MHSPVHYGETRTARHGEFVSGSPGRGCRADIERLSCWMWETAVGFNSRVATQTSRLRLAVNTLDGTKHLSTVAVGGVVFRLAGEAVLCLSAVARHGRLFSHL